jgi:hypothetical protein
VDLERRQPVALLPDRTAETVAQWLRQHPGVEVLARDRSQAYADGARQGAPAATQVADRFHLLQNLRETLDQVFLTHEHALEAVNTLGRTEQTNVKFHRLIESLVKTSNRAFFAQYALNFSVFLSYDVTEITVDFVGDENHYSVNSTLYELSTVSVKLYVPLSAPTHERPVYA